MKIAIIVNRDKPKAWKIAREIIDLLENRGVEIAIEKDMASHLNRRDLGMDLAVIKDFAEIIFVLGGDGTLLSVARHFAPYNIPLLGINAGNMGFLTEAEPDNLNEAVDRVIKGQYYIQPRMMLEAEVYRGDTLQESFIALNEVGIAKGAFSRMIEVYLYIEEKFLTSYKGDGLIISTPTGSTAYSLSAGGPIVVPDVDLMILTPICPHSLNVRPMILSAEQTIRTKIQATHNDIGLTVDGQLGYKLEVDDVIVLNKSAYSAKLIRWPEHNFFEVVRKKLHN